MCHTNFCTLSLKQLEKHIEQSQDGVKSFEFHDIVQIDGFWRIPSFIFTCVHMIFVGFAGLDHLGRASLPFAASLSQNMPFTAYWS